MLFNRNVTCEKCNALTNKNNICTFDFSRQGRNRQGIRTRVCQKCCVVKLVEEFNNYDRIAVVVQPSKGYNAYAFYSFNELNETSEKSVNKNKDTKFIEEMKRLLPQNDVKCNFCEEKAVYSWCPTDIFKDTPFSMEVNETIKGNLIYVCKNCLINLFQKKMKEDNICLRQVFPMVDEVGFYTPWEV